MISRKYLMLRVLMLLMLASVGGILHAAEGDIFTLLDDSNLRQGPDSAYASVGVAQEGEQAVEMDAKGHWLKVRISASGDIGWLYADSLQRTVSGEAAERLSASADVSVEPETKAADQSGIAPDVTVADGLNGDAAVTKTVTEAKNQTENDSSVFVDGAVSSTGSVESVTGQGAVVVSDGLDQQAGSDTASDAVVAQPAMVAEEALANNKVAEDMPSSKLAIAEKTDTGSKVQHVVESASLDEQANVSEPLPVEASQEIAEPVIESEAVADNQRGIESAGFTDEAVRPAVEETGVSPAMPDGQLQTAKTEMVGSSQTQKVEVAHDLNEDETVVQTEIGQGGTIVVVPESVMTPEVTDAAPMVGEVAHQPEKAVADSHATQAVAAKDILSAPIETAQDETVQRETVPAETAPVQAGEMSQVVKTTTIRTGPGSLYDVLGWVGKGARVEAVEQQGDWKKVRMQAGGRTGWIETFALQPITDKPQQVETRQASGLPVQITQPVGRATTVSKAEPEAGTTDGKVFSFVKMANLRAGPDRKLDAVAWAGKGALALEMARKGDWVRVKMQQSGRIGWAYKSLLKRVNTAGGLPVATVMSAQVTEAPSPSSIAGSDAVQAESIPAMAMTDPLKSQPRQQKQGKAFRQSPVRAAQPEVMPIKTVGTENSAGGTETEIGTTKRNLFSFNRKANLRAGPDARFDVVTWAGLGSYASELDRKGDWVRVQMQVSKRIGWVYDRSLALVKAGVSLPTAIVKSGQVNEKSLVQSVKSTRAQAVAGLFTFRQTGNLHAGPGKQYDVIAWGGKNETAKMIAQQGDWRKIRMTGSGKVGWVFNTILIRSGVDHAAVAPPAKPAGSIQGGEIYQALRAEPLRADAMQFSELTDWVSKGEAVALLEWRKGWMRVKPQDELKQAGWIREELLQRTGMTSTKVPNNGKLPGADRVVEYQDRISRGEVFNFSYAALEQALYRIPIEDIHVRIDPDDLKAMFRKDTYDKSSFEIRLRTGRRHLQGRIKVLGSSTRIFKKKSLLIKLDKESTRWYGRRRIALRSMASDKALMREWMAWKLLAAMGEKVPEVHFTRVSFNHGEKTGLYLSIEWMGKQFLEANDLDPNGGFFQPNDASHCGDLNSSENLGLCFDKIAPQDDDFSMLGAMAKAVASADDGDMDAVLAQYFDDESVLNWITANSLVTNGDTYNKNYWLHYSPSRKKWTLIPWDYNLTFGRVYDPFADTSDDRSFKIFNDNFQYFFPSDVGASNPLKDKAVRNTKLRARLETKLKHLLGMEPNGSENTFGWFSPTVMQARIGNLAAVVGKEVYKDTFLTFGEEEFTKTYESLMHYVTAHDHYLAAKLQGPYMWQPSPPFDPTAEAVSYPLPDALYGEAMIGVGGQSAHMTDQGWGYFVARLNLDEPLKRQAHFKVRVEGGTTPKYLPPAQSFRRCIKRSWILSTETPDFAADGTVMVEYIQENSERTEVPVTLHEELLELWMLDGHHWKPLKTEANEYANTLTATGVHLESGHVQRFVACSPF